MKNEKGESKCVKMHVGRRHAFCPTLQVHGTDMPEVNEETYLGDVLSSDGKNSKNIKSRISKGIGIINQIIGLLENICFGPYLFEIAMLLRNSMLVNGTTTNAEIFLGIWSTANGGNNKSKKTELSAQCSKQRQRRNVVFIFHNSVE